MNYSEMSDFEISVRVGDLKGVRWANLDENYSPLAIWNAGNLSTFDPCNSWTDAGPIIEKNGISLSYIGKGHHRGEWGADASDSYTYGDKPLRAAMIVFLMMQESK